MSHIIVETELSVFFKGTGKMEFTQPYVICHLFQREIPVTMLRNIAACFCDSLKRLHAMAAVFCAVGIFICGAVVKKDQKYVIQRKTEPHVIQRKIALEIIFDLSHILCDFGSRRSGNGGGKIVTGKKTVAQRHHIGENLRQMAGLR